MSDFFGGLHTGGGIRRPDVVMNDGPLPPMSISGGGYPAGFNGTPDGKIDYASSLLGNVNPYAYGEADRLSTQTAYLNIPHRVQRIVPTLSLPEAQPWDSGGSFFRLSHQVDDGDIAFVIRAMFSPYELVEEKKKYNRQGILYAVDPVVNLATVNYILHGLQRFGYDKKHVSWHTLWQALGIDHHFAKIVGDNKKLSDIMVELEKQLKDEQAKGSTGSSNAQLWTMCNIRRMRKMVADHIVKNVIRPFGVPTGSERQGGQHQGSNSAITWPVDFVTTLTIDGLVINLVNFWRHEDVNSGDDLMLYVEERNYTEYVLSHHPKNVRKQVFPSLRKWDTLRILDTLRTEDGKKKRQRTNHSENAAAMFLDRMWDFAVGHPVDKTLSVFDNVKKLCNVIDNPVLESIFEEIFDDDEKNLDKFNIVIDSSKEPVFQLVPGICNSASCGVRNAVWRHGYWHIARSQIMHFKYDQHLDIPNGYHAAVRGKVLQATFAPVWTEPLEDWGMGGGPGATVGSTFAVDAQDRHCAPSSKRQRLVGVVANVVGGGGSGIVGGGGGGKVYTFPGIERFLSLAEGEFQKWKFSSVLITEEVMKAVKSNTTGIDNDIAVEIVDNAVKCDERSMRVTLPVTLRLISANFVPDFLKDLDNSVEGEFVKVFHGVVYNMMKQLEEVELYGEFDRIKTVVDDKSTSVFKSFELKMMGTRYYIPSMIATVVYMAERCDFNTLKLPICGPSAIEDFTLSSDAEYTMDLVRLAGAMSIENGKSGVDEVKNCTYKPNRGLLTNNGAKNFYDMSELAELKASVNKSNLGAYMLGAYIGSCIGLGMMGSDSFEECLKVIEGAHDKKDPAFAKAMEKKAVAVASFYAADAGILVALMMWNKGKLDEDDGDIKKLTKTIFNYTFICFVRICYVAIQSAGLADLVDPSRLKMNVEGIVDDTLHGERQLNQAFYDSYSGWEFAMRIKQSTGRGQIDVNGDTKRLQDDLNSVDKGTDDDLYKLSKRLRQMIVVNTETDVQKFANETLVPGGLRLMDIKMKESRKIGIFSSYPLITAKKAVKNLKKFSASLGGTGLTFEDVMNNADKEFTYLQGAMMTGAVDKEVVEKFVDINIEGIHAEHYHKAISACAKEARKFLVPSWKELDTLSKILEREKTEDLIPLQNLLVAPAMILACIRMVRGEAASENMTESEKQYDLIGSLGKLTASSDEEISPAKCCAIACALACDLGKPDVQKLLVEAAWEKELKPSDDLSRMDAVQNARKEIFVNKFISVFINDSSVKEGNLLCHMMFDFACAFYTWTIQKVMIDKIRDSKSFNGLQKTLYDQATVICMKNRNGDMSPENLRSGDTVFSNVDKIVAEGLCGLMVKKLVESDIAKKEKDEINGSMNKILPGFTKIESIPNVLETFITEIAKILKESEFTGNKFQDGDNLTLSEPMVEVPQSANLAAETVAANKSSSKLKKVSAKLLS